MPNLPAVWKDWKRILEIVGDMDMRGKPGIGGSQLDYSSGVIDKTAADAGASGGRCSH